MDNFTKVVNPGSQPEWSHTHRKFTPASVFCKIVFKDKKLSITGVVGPLSNGDARGSCGQIYDSIRIAEDKNGEFNPPWDAPTLAKFIDIWKNYHLNDMKPYTPEMKAAGWDTIAKTPINKYHYIITNDSSKRLKDIQKRLIQAALNEELVILPEEEKRLLNLSQASTGKEIYAYELPPNPEFMEPWTTDFIERTTLGWVRPTEHQDGLLGKQLNGKGYGSSHYFHEVPEEVLQWLHDLPDTTIKPAWI